MMEEEHPTHADIHYRLGQVGEKCESLQASIKSLEHSDEVLTCSIAANHEVVTSKISSINDKVTMLFTGVLIVGFALPLVMSAEYLAHYSQVLNYLEKSVPCRRLC